jgi:signal transduction histidine kinase
MGVLALGLGVAAYSQMESRALERQLRAARVRSLEASDAERRRIQRDLHDSAQQRLVSVRIHLAMMAERMPGDADRQKVEALGRDLEAALKEIRAVTLAGYPDSVLRKGVAASLQAFAAGAPIPVDIEADGVGRLDPVVEQGVYFCCLEALQNVVKHGGRNATARIRFRREPEALVFEVEDSGRGFDPAHVAPGEGLINMADRMELLGARLSIDSRPGLGTRIRGVVPLAEAAVPVG